MLDQFRVTKNNENKNKNNLKKYNQRNENRYQGDVVETYV